MLTGEKLGQALDQAIKLKKVRQADVARHFGISSSSVTQWIKTGRIGKQHLEELVSYFDDVVEPSHWGMNIILSMKLHYDDSNLIDAGVVIKIIENLRRVNDAGAERILRFSESTLQRYQRKPRSH